MREQIENILIACYKKLRERPAMTHPEFVGLFINYIYRDFKIHDGLRTDHFLVTQERENIRCIKKKSMGSYYDSSESELSRQVRMCLEELQWTDFYSFHLRSAFEDPIQDPEQGSIAREAFKNYPRLSSIFIN